MVPSQAKKSAQYPTDQYPTEQTVLQTQREQQWMRKDPRGSGYARITKVLQYKAVITSKSYELNQWDHEVLN
jgi:hypothetical protein